MRYRVRFGFSQFADPNYYLDVTAEHCHGATEETERVAAKLDYNIFIQCVVKLSEEE